MKTYTMISIHEPTQGATHIGTTCQTRNQFQFTHPRRVRLTTNMPVPCMVYFNSRTHAGCDDFFHWKGRWKVDFNSRTHAGCDCYI